MRRVLPILALVLSAVSPLSAAGGGPDAFLPAACVAGWAMDGHAATYTRENLYKYIDGEAELYLPYGFEEAAVGTYAPPGGKGYGIVANIFKMGSLLDAFGIYASYRDPASGEIKLGAEGFVDSSQVMFYQDRYFVRIEASGAVSDAGRSLRSCAEAVSRALPAGDGKPPELDLLKVAGAIPLTERYYPTGLLGHGFFGKGLTAEVMLGGERVKAVVMLAPSDAAASRIFDDYGRYLKGAGVAPEITGGKKSASMHAIDPLYKGVALARSGRFVAGVTGLRDARGGDALTALLLARLGR